MYGTLRWSLGRTVRLCCSTHLEVGESKLKYICKTGGNTKDTKDKSMPDGFVG